MHRRVVIALTVLVLVTTAIVALPVGFAQSSTTDFDATGEPPFQTSPDDFTNTAFEIHLYENSSAKWTVRHTRALNETEREQFETFAARFNTEETETYTDFQLRAGRLTAFGSNRTDRQMNAVGFSREARVDDRFSTRGVIELSFIWTNFSRETAEGLVVGDVFEGGMYLGSGQRFVISHADNLTFVDADPQPDSVETDGNLSASETVTWFATDGGRQFADNRPQVELSVVSPDDSSGVGGETETETDDETTGGTDTATPVASSSSNGFGAMAFLFAVLLLVGLGGAIAWYSGALPEMLPTSTDVSDTTTTDEAAASTDSPTEPAVPDEELLSDEDRVLTLLEENGGRMKQVNIVEETDWSKSKVSMLLSDMEEEGDISKLRVGRENIISIAGEEPDAVGSPFEDE